MSKQYFVRYESNKTWHNYGELTNDHFGGDASTIKSAKSIIRNIRKQATLEEEVRNFRIYDSWAEPKTICVYQEA